MSWPERTEDGIGPAPLHDRVYRLEVLNRVANTIARELTLDAIVQTVTDAATDLVGARFGAFFYNAIGDHGEGYQLYTLSGAPRAAFDKFGMPRNTQLFEPTFRGRGIVRSDDIRADPRYGKSAPHHGMPAGHLPVVSYLAVPVVSRSGEVHGGLFFGHDQPGVFTQAAEDVVAEIAAQAAIALDNTRLLHASQRLAAIVESSDDAILTKDRNSVITSWNDGAARLFGYTAEEAIGRPVTILIPPDRPNEEPAILERILRGERIDHYETVRRRKDGTLLDISTTVSPLRGASGEIVGASTTARDITDRRQAQNQQMLLLREMNHRVKNLFAIASGVVSLSARSATTPRELARNVHERLTALADAHELTLPPEITADAAAAGPDAVLRTPTLKALVEVVVQPYEQAGRALTVSGPGVSCGQKGTTAFALMLHEFATNSVKYGALSTPEGKVAIAWAIEPAEAANACSTLALTWTETDGPTISSADHREGFGTTLVQATLTSLNGEIFRDWRPGGLAIRLRIPMDRLEY